MLIILISTVNLMGLRITMETHFWVCLWRCFYKDVMDEERPTLHVCGTVPSAGVPDWIREVSGAPALPFLLPGCRCCRVTAHSGCTASLPWWLPRLSLWSQHKPCFPHVALAGHFVQHWECKSCCAVARKRTPMFSLDVLRWGSSGTLERIKMVNRASSIVHRSHGTWGKAKLNPDSGTWVLGRQTASCLSLRVWYWGTACWHLCTALIQYSQ